MSHRLGTRGAKENAAIFGKCLFGYSFSSGDVGALGNLLLVIHAHVDKHLREARHNRCRLGGGLGAALDGRQELSGGHEAVTREVSLEKGHVARPFAADGSLIPVDSHLVYL